MEVKKKKKSPMEEQKKNSVCRHSLEGRNLKRNKRIEENANTSEPTVEVERRRIEERPTIELRKIGRRIEEIANSSEPTVVVERRRIEESANTSESTFEVEWRRIQESANTEPTVQWRRIQESAQSTNEEETASEIGSCVQGDKCNVTLLGMLEGHSKAITGISLPIGSKQLYSSGKDGTVRVWDWYNGGCVASSSMPSEVGCLVAEGRWLFAGIKNGVKTLDFQNHTEFLLDGPVGLVRRLVMDDGHEKLFAGLEDGTILVWKWHLETKKLVPSAMLKGHKGAVRTLIVGAGRLYSGSTDSTIKVWDLKDLRCLQTLHGHTKDVTSLLCWDYYLFSASLDNTLKLWAATENGIIEVVCESKYDYAVNTLCGIQDAEANHILLCSFGDNTVRLYDLPSFTERGRIFSEGEVHTIQTGVDGIFFTGDATGLVSVWRLQ